MGAVAGAAAFAVAVVDVVAVAYGDAGDVVVGVGGAAVVLVDAVEVLMNHALLVQSLCVIRSLAGTRSQMDGFSRALSTTGSTMTISIAVSRRWPWGTACSWSRSRRAQ